MTRRIVVIGGGISGLAAAHRLIELRQERGIDLEVLLLEAAERLGGVISTERKCQGHARARHALLSFRFIPPYEFEPATKKAKAVVGQQENVFDNLSYWDIATDFDDTGHGLTGTSMAHCALPVRRHIKRLRSP